MDTTAPPVCNGGARRPGARNTAATKSGASGPETASGDGMSTQRQPGNLTCPASIDDRGGAAFRRVDALDEPARPLGAKRAALQDRRKRSSPARSIRNAQGLAGAAANAVVVSADAALIFLIVPMHKGMLVKRTHCQPRGPRIVHTMKFDCTERFDRWCNCEPVRFEDPLLYDQLLRCGHEALHRTA